MAEISAEHWSKLYESLLKYYYRMDGISDTKLIKTLGVVEVEEVEVSWHLNSWSCYCWLYSSRIGHHFLTNHLILNSCKRFFQSHRYCIPLSWFCSCLIHLYDFYKDYQAARFFWSHHYCITLNWFCSYPIHLFYFYRDYLVVADLAQLWINLRIHLRYPH